ncbi:MAG: hypothetical protein K9L32_01425 [Chromatiaceae bacterium]|nr:hypothetical protein [Chromatiaceae bacterium]MCF8002866.1 hypothetical protein [Chromatiaceae bacterium]
MTTDMERTATVLHDVMEDSPLTDADLERHRKYQGAFEFLLSEEARQ